MEHRIATVIVEPRSLVREALVSLMESNSYHVLCSVGSAADIESGAIRELQPKLVILGALPAESVAEAANSIRRCWQDVKIIMLFEKVSSMGWQKLLASGLDACIPMSASPRTLVDPSGTQAGTGTVRLALPVLDVVTVATVTQLLPCFQRMRTTSFFA